MTDNSQKYSSVILDVQSRERGFRAWTHILARPSVEEHSTLTMVDTGAFVSILPSEFVGRCDPDQVTFDPGEPLTGIVMGLTYTYRAAVVAFYITEHYEELETAPRVLPVRTSVQVYDETSVHPLAGRSPGDLQPILGLAALLPHGGVMFTPDYDHPGRRAANGGLLYLESVDVNWEAHQPQPCT